MMLSLGSLRIECKKCGRSGKYRFAAALIGFEYLGVRWGDGEPLNGYFWGTLIGIVCMLGWIFARLNRKKLPEGPE